MNKRLAALDQLKAISYDDCQHWKHHPVTKCIVAVLEADLDDIKDGWANGAYTHETSAGTAQVNARALGACAAIQDVLMYINEVQNLGDDSSDDNDV